MHGSPGVLDTTSKLRINCRGVCTQVPLCRFVGCRMQGERWSGGSQVEHRSLPGSMLSSNIRRHVLLSHAACAAWCSCALGGHMFCSFSLSFTCHCQVRTEPHTAVTCLSPCTTVSLWASAPAIEPETAVAELLLCHADLSLLHVSRPDPP